MEAAFLLLVILLTGFSILGLYDGLYLHILKYKLYAHQESRFEHLMHTLRGILYPATLFFLYLEHASPYAFYTGIVLMLIDIFLLGIDAYVEKDSRVFMGGLPRWEYIIHLFVNGLHFAAIAVFLVVKVQFTDDIFLRNDFSGLNYYHIFIWLIKNLIPGGILMALLHLIVLFPRTERYWNSLRKSINCC